ncbi:MAG: hypothetical protein DDT23_00018 [candidate division WS2 bacterium]|nr:hypothetical protein [Candidatus Lithacetigena glycinireducens]
MPVKELNYRVTLLKEYRGAPAGSKTWLVDPLTITGNEHSAYFPLRDVLSKLPLDINLARYGICDVHRTDDGFICLAVDGTVKREWRGALSPVTGVYVTPLVWEVIYRTLKHPGRIVLEGGEIRRADIRFRDINGVWHILFTDVVIPNDLVFTPRTITGIRISVKETQAGHQRPRIRNLVLHADTTTLKSEVVSLRLLLSAEKTSLIPQWGSIQTGAFDMVVRDPGWATYPYQLPVRFEVGLPGLSPIMLGFVDNWEKKEVGGVRYWKVDGRDVLKLAKENTTRPDYRYKYRLGDLFSYLINFLGVSGVNEVGQGKEVKWAMFDRIWDDLGYIAAAIQGKITAIDDIIYLRPISGVVEYNLFDSDIIDRPEQIDVAVNKINIESSFYDSHHWILNLGSSGFFVIQSNQVYNIETPYFHIPSDPDSLMFAGLFRHTGEFYSDNYSWSIISATPERCTVRITTAILINPGAIVQARVQGRSISKKSISRIVEDKDSQLIWGEREASVKLKFLESGVEVENLAYAILAFYSGISRYKLTLTLRPELRAGSVIRWKDRNFLIASVEHSLPACTTIIEIEEIKPWEVTEKLLRDLSAYKRVGVTANRYYIAGHLGGGVATTLTVSANTIYAMPLILPQGVNIDRLLSEITVLSAGNARFGIYSDENIHPRDLILNAGEVSTGSTGVRERSLNQNLTGNRLYWFVIHFSATPTVRAIAREYVLPVIGAPVTLGADITPSCWILSRAYADGLPAIMPAMTTANINIPAIAVRIASYI